MAQIAWGSRTVDIADVFREPYWTNRINRMNNLSQTYLIDTITQRQDLNGVEIRALCGSANGAGYEVVSVLQMGNKLFRSVAIARKSLKKVNDCNTHREPWGQFLIGIMGTAFAAAILYCIYSFAFTLMLRQWV